MDIIVVLEQLAKNTHYDTNNKKLLSLLPEKMTGLLQKNDFAGLKKYLSSFEYPSESYVVQLHLDKSQAKE